MSNRGLTIALVASVGLNLFVVAAATTLLISRERVEDRVAEQRRPPGRVPVFAALEGVDAETRQRVREAMRASGRASHPDFEAARAARRSAIEMAGAESFDAAAVNALLARSREAEARGRARLERDTVAVLESLEAEDRAALAPVVLSMRQGRGGRVRSDRSRIEEKAAPAR